MQATRKGRGKRELKLSSENRGRPDSFVPGHGHISRSGRRALRKKASSKS